VWDTFLSTDPSLGWHVVIINFDYQYILATVNDIHGNTILQHERTRQLERRKAQYQWQYFKDTGLPSGIDDTVEDLPADEEFSRVKSFDFTQAALGDLIRAASKWKMAIKRVHDYFDLAKPFGTKPLEIYRAGRWTSDVQFGHNILNGVNPMVIKKCTALPSNFPVTNEMVEPFFTCGMTLEQEMEVSWNDLQ
jgi:hypothetical protein